MPPKERKQWNTLTEADFRKHIKTSPATGYLLFGEEDYLKSYAISQAKQTLVSDPSLACFNEITIDAADFTPERLRSALMALPMMADRKLVILYNMRPGEMRSAEQNALCEVLQELEEYDYNTLLLHVADGGITQGTLPYNPSPLLRRLGELLVPVRFERCTTQKLIGWCVRHFEHHGVTASPAVCTALIDRCGHGMFTLAGEIDKISFYLLCQGKSAATEQDVAAVACACPEFEAFALTNALSEGNTARALDVLADLKFRRVEPTLVLGEITGLVQNLLSVSCLMRQGTTPAEIAARLGWREGRVAVYQRNVQTLGEQRLRRLLRACVEADRALKSSTRDYAALEVLICSI